jgi:RNA polymerase sigma factor (sigma-70 family)
VEEERGRDSHERGQRDEEAWRPGSVPAHVDPSGESAGEGGEEELSLATGAILRYDLHHRSGPIWAGRASNPTFDVNLVGPWGLGEQRRRGVSVDPRFQDLYEREYGAVFRAAYVLCGDVEAAEDSTQEAFARCLERWGRLKDQTWVGGWVTSTALNHARRGLRRRRGAPEERDAEHDVDASLDLWRGIRGLPKRQQQAVMLHYAGDMAVSEVARVMGCDEGTVKAHLARARAALRRGLSPQEEVRNER